jgi:hypothetical protein
MLPTSVVCWKWKPKPGYRSVFGPDTVNVLRRMVARHFHAPHRFICVTDDANGIDPEVEIQTPWNDFADIPSPHGGNNPSCFRRLRAFHPHIAEFFGPRFVSLDLDCVITSDITPIWDRPEDFVIWGDFTNPKTAYNGSMFMLTAGARPQVWGEFDPAWSPFRAKQSGCWGSDQGWITFRLGTGEARWTRQDGVFSFRNDVAPSGKLPAGARIVIFHGAQDPWGEFAQKYEWVRTHYR